MESAWSLTLETLRDPNFAGLPNCGYMRLPAVLELIPVSKSTWWAGVKSGRFPKPKKFGPRITAWDVRDIRILLEREDAQKAAGAALPN